MPSRSPLPSPSRAGRPRSAAADAAILQATREALVELGWSKLTMGEVAARAGVAKTTLYRRWHSKGELVVDTLAALFDELSLPETGTLSGDVEGVVLQFAELLDLPEINTALLAIVSESTRDEPLRDRIRISIVQRQKRLVTEGRRRAQERGELPAETDESTADETADLIFDTVAGAVLHRLLVSAVPIDRAWARRLTQLLLTGIAGLAEDQAQAQAEAEAEAQEQD